MEIICVYRNENYELCNRKFSSFEWFGKWVADNATEIQLIDVIQEEY